MLVKILEARTGGRVSPRALSGSKSEGFCELEDADMIHCPTWLIVGILNAKDADFDYLASMNR